MPKLKTVSLADGSETAEGNVCYLAGPPALSGFVIQIIRQGKVLAVEMNLAEVEAAYRSMPSEQFLQEWVGPAFEQLFPSLFDEAQENLMNDTEVRWRTFPVAASQSFDVVPTAGREHMRSDECWCKPVREEETYKGISFFSRTHNLES